MGLRINEARMLDLDDVRWELGRFGKLNVRHGKGSRRRGPKPRLVPLINGADQNLRWFIQDVWGQFGADHTRPGAPLFPSERKCLDGSCSRASADVFRQSLAEAAARHLPAWAGKLTPHVLRHFCASQLYLAGMSLFAIQELLGHAWTGTTAPARSAIPMSSCRRPRASPILTPQSSKRVRTATSTRKTARHGSGSRLRSSLRR